MLALMQRLLLIVDKQLTLSSVSGESSLESTCNIKSSDLAGQQSGMKENGFIVKIYYFYFFNLKMSFLIL